MKPASRTQWLVFGLVLSVAVAGCRHRPVGVTTLPGYPQGRVSDEQQAKGYKPDEKIEGFPVADPGVREHWLRDRDIFKTDTVYFDFDSTVIKTREKSKVAGVADYLKGNTATALEIEGHCDERGTEEYNRSLGERRALALREELIRLGVEPKRIDTTSYGKDRPAVPGHDESAYRKNRRGEFLLETPPK